jgi:hypothetical protein
MWTAISSKLYDLLTGVTGVGTVLTYSPVIKTMTDLKANFPLDDENRFNAWIIERNAFRIDRSIATLHTQEWIHTFTISGWKSIVDSNQSYLDFQNLVETIMEAFSENITMGLPNSTMALSPNVDVIEEAFIGEILCNHVRITVPVRELRTVNYR